MKFILTKDNKENFNKRIHGGGGDRGGGGGSVVCMCVCTFIYILCVDVCMYTYVLLYQGDKKTKTM